jgi:hypothetical protein
MAQIYAGFGLSSVGSPGFATLAYRSLRFSHIAPTRKSSSTRICSYGWAQRRRPATVSWNKCPNMIFIECLGFQWFDRVGHYSILTAHNYFCGALLHLLNSQISYVALFAKNAGLIWPGIWELYRWPIGRRGRWQGCDNKSRMVTT